MLTREYGKSKNYKITITKCFVEKIKQAKKVHVNKYSLELQLQQKL